MVLLCGCPAAGDGPPIDDTGVPIAVEVRDLGAPAVDVSVIFHRADGTVVSWASTDRDGVARGDGVAGGMVTALSWAGGLRRAVSVAEIGADEAVLVEMPDIWGTTWDQRDLGEVVGTLDVDVPEMPGADAYEFFLGCTSMFSQTPRAVLEVPERCVGADDRIDVQATSWINGKPLYTIGLSYVGDVAFARGGTTRLSLPPWDGETYATVDFALDNAPAGSVTARVAGGMRADGLPFVGTAGNGPTSAVLGAGESADLELDYLADFGDGLDFTVALEHTTGRSHFTAVDHPRTDLVTLDLGADLLPPVLSHEADDSDWQRPRIAWQLAGPADGADALFVYAHWFADSGDLFWFYMAPSDGRDSAVFPELPAELAGFSPPGPDFTGVFYDGVYAFDADWIDGYDDLRRAHGPGFLAHAELPAGAHTIRYVYGGVAPVAAWVGRFPAAPSQ